ncbi:hypothetical protein EVAR_29278_1 [Eumeta japonica]|uniref:Uncharacterized protein n=1 Tax=Eumeta variegata TaxID=151549 RepID=A0A4C1VXC0_EUMVA|nr:hypothetical protein EVAR_29278_1 [Eumeta japonica]
MPPRGGAPPPRRPVFCTANVNDTSFNESAPAPDKKATFLFPLYTLTVIDDRALVADHSAEIVNRRRGCIISVYISDVSFARRSVRVEGCQSPLTTSGIDAFGGESVKG